MKLNRQIKDFEWMNELNNAKSLSTDQWFAAVSFRRSIAHSVGDETTDIVKDTHFVSLTMDGTTDKAAVEQETLFLRTASHGKIITKYLCVGVPEATSVVLHDLVKRN